MTKKQEPETEESEELKIEKVSRRNDLDMIIEDYITESEQRETTPKMKVYKYDNDRQGNDNEFIGYFTGNDIPDKHHIGLMFGGGRYKAFLFQPKGKAEKDETQGIVFRIGHIYDEKKRQHDEQKRKEDAVKMGFPEGAVMARTSNQAAESFGMVKELLSVITPLIKAQAAAAPATAATPAPDLMAQYAMMQQILRKNLFDTAETYRNFSRRFNFDQEQQGFEQDEPEQEEKEPGFMAYVEKIIKMIEPFFGLLAQKGAAAQVTAQTVRAAPQFAELLSDPQLCRMIIQYFDQKKGKEASDLALKNLGINRSALFAATTAKPGGPANQPAAARRLPGRPKAIAPQKQ